MERRNRNRKFAIFALYISIEGDSIMKYPIGIQSFEQIRNDGYVYVDKTDLTSMELTLRRQGNFNW